MPTQVILDYQEYQSLLDAVAKSKIKSSINKLEIYNDSDRWNSRRVVLERCELSDPEPLNIIQEAIDYNDKIRVDIYNMTTDMDVRSAALVEQQKLINQQSEELRDKLFEMENISFSQRLKYLFTNKLPI